MHNYSQSHMYESAWEENQQFEEYQCSDNCLLFFFHNTFTKIINATVITVRTSQ